MTDHAPLSVGALLSSWLENNVTRPLYTLSLAAMICYAIWIVLQKRGRTTSQTTLGESNPRENEESSAVDSKPGPGSDVNAVEVSPGPQDPSHLGERVAAPQVSLVGTEKGQDKEDEDLRTQPRLGPQEMFPRKREHAPNGLQQSDVSGPREMAPRKREPTLNGIQQLDFSQNTPRENGVRDDGQDHLRPAAMGKLPRKRSELVFEDIQVPPSVHQGLNYFGNEGKYPRKKAAPQSDAEGSIY